MSPFTRRDFVALGAAALAALPKSLRAQSPDAIATKLAADPMRPQFHLLPARNWMNDPNGPIYFAGNYHMFFQYNPLAATWGDMSWNHAISKDMVHWQLLPVAMTPTPGSYDSFGVFSGSAIAVGKRVYQVYTGTKQGPKDLATIAGDPNNVQESQCLAWSDDPRLIHWTKADNPIIPLPPTGMKITGFRDPSVWKQNGVYYMTVGSGEAQVGGCVLLYRSKDLHTWEYLHKLTSGTWNGKPTQNPCDDGEMWECPDFFPLDGKHVLIYSTLGKVFWQSGKLDEATMLFHPEHTGLLDLDAFYAPKTQLDAHGRRILWGWIPERRSEDAMRSAGWSGMMSLPRILNLDPDGILRITTPQQVSALRGTAQPQLESLTGIRKLLPGASGELLCTGRKGSAFELQLSCPELPELLRVKYLPDTHSFLADGKEIKLQPADTPTLHAYIDGSVIELILGERIGYTKRFYYTAPTAPDVQLSATGAGLTSLDAWQMHPISPNRLTTL
ncbi:glycoside hydrolase family 32 protein [Granulicella paludicola]|uniref:glycoside hydrolase family 32 protein n=1 Tax=Granulicella paludicola TaxID=474951 RepID=UPI0021E01344|nr:glycoside hydrolase family 32 protein [Granulicella paludicola]